MNFLLPAVILTFLFGFSGETVAQTANDKNKVPREYRLKLQFPKPDLHNIPNFPPKKLFLFKNGKLAKSDFDNMPFYIPDLSKSIKMPDYKPDPKINYTIRKFKLHKNFKMK